MTADAPRQMIRWMTSSSRSSVVTLQRRINGRHCLEDVVQLFHLVLCVVVGLHGVRLGRALPTGRGSTEAGRGGGRRGGCRQRW